MTEVTTKAKATTATKTKAKSKASAKKDKCYYGTGRRKSSTARVYLRKGAGKITINKLDVEKYFGRESAKMVVRQALVLVDMTDNFDITINVKGGGNMGQAGAIRHGITRALLAYDEEDMTKPAKAAKASNVTKLKKLEEKGKEGEESSSDEGESSSGSSSAGPTSFRKIS